MKDYICTYTRDKNGKFVLTDKREKPSNWKGFQKEAIRIWKLYTNEEETNQINFFEDLIANSSPKYVKELKFSLNEEFIGDCDLYIDIESDFGTSNVYLSSAENDADILLWFVEALTFDKKEYYFTCSEEGPDTFFYVKTIDDKNVRFVHISNKKMFESQFPIVTEESFKILQDFIINKYTLIEKIYNSLMLTIRNTNPDKINYWEVDVFEDMKKNSKIITNYLKNTHIQ